MNNLTRVVIIVIGLVVIVGAFLIARPGAPAADSTQLLATATYACDAGKSITAAYYQGSGAGSVMLTLSDGRTMTLPQTISADGARYANVDESIVFWNKGNGAMFTEAGAETYTNCAAPTQQ